MNEVQCTIPAELLQFTVTALTKLAVLLGMAADNPPCTPEAAADLREQEETAKKAAEFCYNLLLRERPVDCCKGKK